jgi:hypothetical protein
MPRKKRRRIGDPPELDFESESGALVQTKEQVEAEVRASLALPEKETSQESLQRIAQDAVLILRREFAFRAEMALRMPGLLTVFDLNQLLRTMAGLTELARDPEESQQKANYDRLTPAERVQLAALQLKVTYE